MVKPSYREVIETVMQDRQEKSRMTIAAAVKAVLGNKFNPNSFNQAMVKLSNERVIKPASGKLTRGVWVLNK